jgi:hypothetical protein
VAVVRRKLMSKISRETEELIFRILQRGLRLPSKFVHNRGTEVGDGDGKPDFEVTRRGGKLGVEITEIYQPLMDDPLIIDEMPLQQHEAEKDRIVRAACDKAIQLSLPPVRVSVMFTGNLPKKKDRKTDLVETLVEMVRDNLPELGRTKAVGGFDGDLPEGFHWIGVDRTFNPKKHSWRCDEEPGDIETHFSAQLQDIINAKASKLPNYRKHCDRCWLVIAALGRRPSSFYEFADDMAKHRYESPFERVFFVVVASAIIRELKLMK